MADFGALFTKLKAAPKATAPRTAAPAPAQAASPSKKKKRKRQQPASAPAGPSAEPVRQAAGAMARQQAGAQAALAGARFRDINEQLYTRDSAHAQRLFTAQPELYDAYHAGFRLQAARWPQRPVGLIIEWLRSKPSSWVVGDLGCGDAEIAASVPQTVHSFDLVATNSRVVACDISRLPLADATLDVAVFCLALMGANYVEFIREAHRALRPKGILRIAEVRSRIADIKEWVAMLRDLGFGVVGHDDTNSHFVHLELRKRAKVEPAKRGELKQVDLKPCIYKRR